MKIVITIECEDDNDFDWLKGRLLQTVKGEIEEQDEQVVLEGKVEVTQELTD